MGNKQLARQNLYLKGVLAAGRDWNAASKQYDGKRLRPSELAFYRKMLAENEARMKK